MRLLLSLLGLILVFGSSAQTMQLTKEEKVWISQHPVVTYAFSPEWKPFEIVHEGKYSGISNDFLSLVSEKTGLQFEGTLYENWAGCLSAVQKNEVDLIPCLIKTPERSKFLIFTSAYSESPVVIVTKRDYPYVQNLEFFNGKTLAMAKSYSNTDFIMKEYPKINILSVNNSEEAIRKVSSGEADGTIEDLPIVSYYIYYEGFQDLKIAAPISGLEEQKLHMAVNKNDTILLGIINKVFHNIYPLDKNEIYAKWIAVKHDQTSDVNRVIRISVIILGSLLILIFLILFMNKKLKKEIVKREIIELDLEKALTILDRKNREKQMMLKEIHHRVKNNLQVINSLLGLQSIESKDEKTLMMFKEAQNRVITMALLHEKLYQSFESDRLNIAEHFELIGTELIKSFSSSQKVSFETKIVSEKLDSKILISIGLILNELITNSMKYAFDGVEKPKIYLSVRKIDKDGFEMIYQDNGVGVNYGILEKKTQSLGMTLITTLTEQLEGTIKQLQQEGIGFQFYFPYNEMNE